MCPKEINKEYTPPSTISGVSTIFIERPDEHEVKDELYCWMPGNSDRECNGSCVSYDPSYISDQFKDTCKVLNSIRAISKAFVFDTQKRNKQMELSARKEQADSLPRPPEVK